MHSRERGQRPQAARAWQRRHVVMAAALAVASTGCGGARPYRLMAKAARSETSVVTQVEDQRLKSSMRQALLRTDPGEVLAVTPYAYMGHGYLVGYVDNAAQRQTLIDALQGIEGMRALDTDLPEKPPGGSTTTDNLETKASVKAALALDPSQVVSRIDIEVLNGQVVLLGVVDSQQTIDSAVAHARSASGVTGVTNFLLSPEPEYEKLRPSLR